MWGMGFTQIYQESLLYFWLNPIIGIGFGVAIIPLIFRSKLFAESFKSIFRKHDEYSSRRSGPPLNRFIYVGLFIFGCIGAVILDKSLVPDFPLWALFLYEIVFPLMTLLALGRMIGLTGQAPEIPYLQQLTIIASGYKGLDVWFLPLSLNPGTGWLRSLKLCQLTKTTTTSWIKATLIAWPVSLIAGMAYTQIFWSLSPIPSELYPTPAIQWPINIMHKCVWMTRPKAFFDPLKIIGAFIIYGVLTTIVQFLGLPISMVSISVGLSSPLPSVTTMLIGLIIREIISRQFNKNWINRYRNTIGAGLICGEGIAIVLGVAIAMAIKSVSSRIF